MKHKIISFLKNTLFRLLTDKVFLEAIIPILELISKSTKNNIDDTCIKLLKDEAEKMIGEPLITYKDNN